MRQLFIRDCVLFSGLFWVLLFGLSGCAGSGPSGAGRGAVVEVVGDSIESYPIPAHEELITHLQRLGVGYVIDVGHSPESAEGYLTSCARAMSLGIYGADLSYAATYGVKSDVEKYYKSVQTVARALNIRSERLDRAEKNLEGLTQAGDSLRILVSEAVAEIYALFCSNRQQEEASLFMAGGWVEAAYIGTYIASLSTTNEAVVKLFIDQKRSYETIVRYLERYKKTDESVRMLSLLQELRPDFEALVKDPKNDELMQRLTSRLEYIRTGAISMPLP